MDDSLRTAKSRRLALAIKIVFAQELLCIALVACLGQITKNMGAGGIIFILPFLVCYSVILSSLVAIPILSIVRMRTKASSSRLDSLTVWIALLLNVAGLIMLAISLVDVYLQLGNIQNP